MPGRQERAWERGRVALAARRLPEWGRVQAIQVPPHPRGWGRRTPPPAEIRASTANRPIRTFSPPRPRGRGRQLRPREMPGLVTLEMACRSAPSGAARAMRIKWPLVRRPPKTDSGRQHRLRETPASVRMVRQAEARVFRTSEPHELETRCWMPRPRSSGERLCRASAVRARQDQVCDLRANGEQVDSVHRVLPLPDAGLAVRADGGAVRSAG